MKWCCKSCCKAQRIIWGLAAGLGVVVWLWTRCRREHDGRNWQRGLVSPTARMALVTGASAGIGQAYARSLAARGYGLVLVARREERLQALAAEYREQYGVPVEVLVADLSAEAGIARVEGRITGGEAIDFLVNNAGYDVFGNFVDIPIDKTLGLIHCLQLATVRLTRAALPGMIQRNRGAVVNVSSIGAFGPKRKDATYVAAKAYINRFTETLALELRGTQVRVQALCPGFTLTEFHDAPEYAQYKMKERIPAWLWMEPQQVVDGSLRGLVEGQVVCVPGFIYKVIAAALRSGLSGFLLGILANFFPKQKLETS